MGNNLGCHYCEAGDSLHRGAETPPSLGQLFYDSKTRTITSLTPDNLTAKAIIIGFENLIWALGRDCDNGRMKAALEALRHDAIEAGILPKEIK